MKELKPCQLDEARKVLWYCAQFTDNTHWAKQYRKALTDICNELDHRAAPENKPNNAGLHIKYDVRKVSDGSIVNNCFVLRPDRDPSAITALRAYADATENKALAEDIYKWVGRAPENKPLTLEQLRQMDGEPVWIAILDGSEPTRCEIVVECYKDGIKMASTEETDDYGAFDLYGKTWLAYARRPEEEK